MSTITGTTITQGVTLGTAGNYISPLTITTTGAINAAADNGVYAPFTLANQAVVNQGTILAQKAGVRLTDGGSVNNSGLIAGGTAGSTYSGVYVRTNGTVTNTGTILGGGGENGVRLSRGGVLNNNAGLIQAYDGVYVNYSAVGTVTNAGTIAGTAFSNSFGIDFAAFIDGAYVSNSSSGLIIAATAAVRFSGAGTVVNAGTIEGTSGAGIRLSNGGTVIDSGTIGGANYSLYFYGANNLLVLQNRYSLQGNVIAGGTAGGITIQLAGTTGNAVTVNYGNLGLEQFHTVDVLFGGGGNATLATNNSGGSLPATISGFNQTSDIIDLTQIGNNGVITNNDTTNHRVTVSGSFGTVSFQFDAITESTNLTTASDGASGTNLLVVACFRRGTMILTDQGERPVEGLSIGDKVVTLSGAAEPIKWIGHRAYDPRFIHNDSTVLPIRIAAGALGDGVPARDLWVSPEHALFIDGALVAARLLVNGTTIAQERAVDALEYFHIELAAHDVILADGAPAETYVERSNRGMFHNAAAYRALYPDGTEEAEAFCARRLDADAPELAEIRARISDRIAGLSLLAA